MNREKKVGDIYCTKGGNLYMVVGIRTKYNRGTYQESAYTHLWLGNTGGCPTSITEDPTFISENINEVKFGAKDKYVTTIMEVDAAIHEAIKESS